MGVDYRTNENRESRIGLKSDFLGNRTGNGKTVLPRFVSVSVPLSPSVFVRRFIG